MSSKIFRAVLIGAVSLVGAMAFAENPPSWAVGIFTGTNEATKADVQLEINSNGAVRLYSRLRRNVKVVSGNYRDDALRIGKEVFQIRRTSRGLRFENLDNRDEHGDLRKVDEGWAHPGGLSGEGNDDDDRSPSGGVPAWLRGEFKGTTSRNSRFELLVRRDGTTRLISRRGLEQTTFNGRYRNGVLDYGDLEYRVTKDGNRIRIVNRDNSDDNARLSPSRDNDSDVKLNLTLERPREDASYNNEVTIEGRSNGSRIVIDIYNSDGKKVATRTLTVRSATFRVTIDLPNGRYKAAVEASRDGSELRKVVEFRIR
jgi:hypothetical protein